MALDQGPALRRNACAAFITLFSLIGVHAQVQVNSEPLLRIEVGAHAAPIRALSVDATGQFAVTAAEDKTARVWSLSNGALLQTLRPPIGPGNDGKLFAAAITPDSATIALGGWSADNDVYLFDRSSGQMLQRITGLPNTITRLEFAPDGRSLVIGLWGSHGIRQFASDTAWRTSRELGSDRQYEGEVHSAAFSPDGKQLTTTSADGQVRLYRLSLAGPTLAKSVRAEGGRQPFGVAYSPDGSKLALGFADTAAVAVLQADSLAQAYAPDVSGVGQGSLTALAWSSDGRVLYGAGTWRRPDGKFGLRQWNDQGRGATQDSALGRNSVVGLQALADGRLVFAATDPAWGWVAPSGQHLQTSGLADFRGARQAFRVSRDGSGVAFGFETGSDKVMGFDLSQAQWQAPQAAWLAPAASAKGVIAQDWLDSPRPKLNGRVLALADNERAMSAALAPAGSGLALGTSFNLRYFQVDGSELWRVPTPAPAWQVNVSGDGRWVLAALGDGTVRWYRSRDGAEQLSLLPHTDGKRWVVWTPKGHYLASPGGEDLFGWHIPRGASRSADFFPGSRLRASLLRPDVIHRVLATADLDSAVREADLAANRPSPAAPVVAGASKPASSAAPSLELSVPPLVTVLSPTDGARFSSRELTLSITVRAPRDAPTLGLRARLNGNILELPQANAGPWLEPSKVPTRSASSPLESEVSYSQRITVPGQDLELMLFAQNRNGYSSPAVLHLKWVDPKGGTASVSTAPTAPSVSPPSTTAAPAGADLRPALYVLAVGVSKYRDPALQLDYAAKDADDFVKAFKQQENQLYRKVSVKLLRDDKAKRDDILDGLEWIRREMTARDVGVVFFGGHGVNDSDGVYYYLPQDADVDKLKRSGVIFTEIRNTLAALPGKALFFIDTCHSGNVLGTGRRGVANDITAVVNELSSAENGVIVFAASTGRQFAQESAKWGNGAFTRAVIEGMGGKADTTGSGRITHKMLDLYISERVKAMTRGTQSPVTIVPQGIPDFPVAITR